MKFTLSETGVNNLIVVSDLHCGCQVGLCPPGVRVDYGSIWNLNVTQERIWAVWREFWDDWVPMVTRGEPFAVLLNGDAMDGSHHRSKTQITHNFSDQQNIAEAALAPVVEACEGRFYMVRGTEAHVGQCAENEERLGRALGSVVMPNGNHTDYELWARVGERLVHATHHIGTTSRTAYETSALQAEWTEMMTDAGRWGREPPDVVVRSHRHRHIQITAPTANTYGITFTTPAWQAKTPFVWKVARIGEPQFGGSLIRAGNEEIYARHYVRTLGRSAVMDIATGGDADEGD